MNWKEVLKLKMWSPASELNTDELVPVLDEIYQVGDHTYIRIQPFNESLELGDPRAPFVTRAYWASSFSGLKRIILGDPEFKGDDSSLLPPLEIALGTSGLYSEIVKKIPEDGGRVIERAEYSNKGKFLMRSVSVGRFEYCFSRNTNKDEMTFFIKVSLLK